MDIDVATLKALRTRTEAGLLDCRRALAETGGELEPAAALLATWGLAGVQKRAEREAREGRVFIDQEGGRAACVLLACETDFVARNQGFLELGGKLARMARERGGALPDPEMDGLVAAFAGTVKENLALRKAVVMEAGPGERLEAYLHGEGRIGVLLTARVEPESALADGEVAAFVHALALQVAAFHPDFVEAGRLSGAELDALRATIAREIEEDEALRAKPAGIREGAAAGRLRKRLAERSLLDHRFVRDEEVTVRAAMASLAAREGLAIGVGTFACLRVED